jgi:transcriptional regulator with XRE-family HTH domain
MSQQELGAAVGREQKDISQYENGETFPRPERLTLLAQHLGVSVADLFSGDDVKADLDPELLKIILLVQREQKRDPGFVRRALRLLRSLIDT